MLFSSATFVYVFLPIFLGATIFSIKFLKSSTTEWFILSASTIFYCSYNLPYSSLLICSIIFNFLIGKKIYIAQQKQSISECKRLLFLGVSTNIFAICYFKYSNFFIENVNYIFKSNFSLLEILLPLGISFFTFQQIAYLVDIYKGNKPEPTLKRYAIFVSFFPQLIAGPIVHHKHFLSQLEENFSSKWNVNYLVCGLSIFLVGLFKKVVIADNIGKVADIVFDAADAGETMVFLESWFGAICYAFQIYFDFSAYSDMAIGLGLMIGIMLPLNFNSPYKSTSIIGFWRLWHITLSSFLKNYLYIPLGGNKLGSFNRYRNLMIVMFLGGLWHGSGWNFVIWGCLHGIYLSINHLWRNSKTSDPNSRIVYKFFCWLLTMFFVTIAWVFFRAETFSGAIEMIRAMLLLSEDLRLIIPYSLETNSLFSNTVLSQLTSPGLIVQNVHILDGYWLYIKYAILVCGCICLLLPNTLQIFNSYISSISSVSFAVKETKFNWKPSIAWGIFIGILTTLTLIMLTESTEFIYFEF